jgi:hypothetical protein
MLSKIVFFSLIVCCLIRPTPPERLVWDADRQLEWSDFKGSPDYLLDYVATTNSGMSHSYGINGNGFLDKSTSSVLAHFYPTFSWYKPADTTAAILRHEQTHFDITEVYARKLRKRIQEYVFTANSNEEIKQLYKTIETERREAQRLFDQETDHSRLKDRELFWAERIRDSLEKYWVYTP